MINNDDNRVTHRSSCSSRVTSARASSFAACSSSRCWTAPRVRSSASTWAARAAITALRPHVGGDGGRLILVFGCGGDRDRGKRPQMGRIAAELADRIVVTDDNPRGEEPGSIRREVLAGCPVAVEIGDRAEAIATAIHWLVAGDILLIAGKGHETGQDIAGVVHPFDDVAVAAEVLRGMSA